MNNQSRLFQFATEDGKYNSRFMVTIVGVTLLLISLFSLTIDPWVLSEGASGKSEISWSFLTIVFSVLYFVFSFRFWNPVKQNQNAALIFFGNPFANVGPGPVFAPLGLVSVVPVTASVIQREFPAEPEKIYRGSMKEDRSIKDDEKPPVRVQFRDSISQDDADNTFGDDKEACYEDSEGRPIEGRQSKKFIAGDLKSGSADDGLSKRVTAEPFPVIRFLIVDPKQFIRNIGDVGDAVKQIEDEMFSVIYRYYPRISVAQALQNLEWMNVLLYNAVSQRVGESGKSKSWGIKIEGAFIKSIYIDHGINTAISAAAQAPFTKSATIISAEGTRKKSMLEGEGIANAAKNLEEKTLEGRSKGLKELAEQLGITGDEAIAQFTAAKLAESDGTIILGEPGLGQLVSAGSDLVNKQKKVKPETSEE